MPDIRTILDPLAVDKSVKAQAWDDFHAAGGADDFKARFDKLNIPREAKAALWDLKFSAPSPSRDAAPAAAPLPPMPNLPQAVKPELAEQWGAAQLAQQFVNEEILRPARGVAAMNPGVTEILGRVGSSVAGPGTSLGEIVNPPTNPLTGKPVARAPWEISLVNFSNLGLEDATPGAIPKGVVQALQELASGLTSPALAFAGGKAAQSGHVAKRLLSGAFSVDMVKNALEQSPEFAERVAAGDAQGAARALTHVLGSATFSATAARHALNVKRAAKAAKPAEPAKPAEAPPMGDSTVPAEPAAIAPPARTPADLLDQARAIAQQRSKVTRLELARELQVSPFEARDVFDALNREGVINRNGGVLGRGKPASNDPGGPPLPPPTDAEAPPARVAPEPQPSAAPAPRSPGKLPRELAGAKPRYAFGERQFELEFDSEVDKAAYITAQLKRSKRDADYLRFVQDQTGLDEADVRKLGLRVRGRVKDLARNAEPGVLRVAESSEPPVKVSAADAQQAIKTLRRRREMTAPLKRGPINAQIAELERYLGEPTPTPEQARQTRLAEAVTAARKANLPEDEKGRRTGPADGGKSAPPRAGEGGEKSGIFGSERGAVSGELLTLGADRALKAGIEAGKTAGKTAADVARPLRSLVQREGRAGAELMRRIDRATDEGEVEAGKRIARLQEARLNRFTPEQKTALVDALEGRAVPTDNKVARAFESVRSITDEMALEAEDVGVRVQTSEGKRRFVARRNYFPHVIYHAERLGAEPVRSDVIKNMVRLGVAAKPEGAAVLLDQWVAFERTGDRKHTKELLAWLIKTGQATDEADAFAKLQRRRESTIKRAGSLEFSREIDLPFWDPDPARVLPAWIARSSLRLRQTKHLGQEDQVVKRLLLVMERAGGDADTARKRVELILQRANKGDDKPHEALFRAARSVQALKLGLASIPNSTQGVLNSLLVADVRDVFAAIATAPTKRGRRLGIESGASLDSVIRDSLREAGAGEKGAGRALGLYLKATGFTETERANRVLAANVGAKYSARLLRRLQRNANDGRARDMLAELGVDADAALKRGRLSEDDVLMAAKKFSDMTQFRVRPQDLPEFATDSELGKTVFQFKSFVYNQTRLLKHELYDELVVKKRPGSAAASALVLATAFPVAGELVADLRKLIKGLVSGDIERDEEGWARYIDDAAQMGVLGMLGDMVESGKRRRGAEYLAGPTVGDAAGLLEATSSGKPRSVGRFALKAAGPWGSMLADYLFPPERRRR